TTITADVILFTSFYPIPTDMMRATFRTIHVLAPYIHTLLCNAFGLCYDDARLLAADETELHLATFPEQSPFTPEQALNPDFLPDTISL
ncbi:DUF29 domain-containing protein, partial [Nostoc sp. CHAB 5834]|nr:DUF29 domain-containing protein [Nostoc sp. CHAB 5834]